MKTLVLIIGLALLASLSACSDSDTTGPVPVPKPPAVATENERVERSAQYAQDVATFEKAVGKGHGLTPKQIHQAMEMMRSNPSMRNKFLGVTTLQNPTDAWIVMEIIQEVKPDLFIDSGTFHGGSAALWAVILEEVNPSGRVITIDIEDQREQAAIDLPISKRKVDFLLGSSTDPAIVAEVHRRAVGKRVLVLLDSLHSKEHVAAELAAYTPLVQVGGYVIVQDTGLGALAAIDEFLAKNDGFKADRARERYADTNSVRGYLRRLK